MSEKRTGPITPDEALQNKKSSIPDVVFDVFNELIAERYIEGQSLTIFQDEVVARICSCTCNDDDKDAIAAKKQEIFDKHWLDVEQIYRSFGWTVIFDKPGYCENYKASFKFKASK